LAERDIPSGQFKLKASMENLARDRRLTVYACGRQTGQSLKHLAMSG
jgi:hypothetical protein